jgi:hypothetical protein
VENDHSEISSLKLVCCDRNQVHSLTSDGP